mgnify:FL=1
MKIKLPTSRNGKESRKKVRKKTPFWDYARKFAADILRDPADLLKVAGLMRSRDVPSLAALGKIQDQEYQDPDMYNLLAMRQVAALFKKNEEFADDNACSSVAENSFKAAEKRCRITNKRLDHYGTNRERLPMDLQKWLGSMERVIARILGDVTEYRNGIPSSIRLTSGATEDRRRNRSLPFLKITGQLRCTNGSRKWLTTLLHFFGVEETSVKIRTIARNVLAFVPKNWQTHRTIAKEPTHTLPFQLTVDHWIKRQLRRWGVDLSSQSKNQEYARLGSIDGTRATVDLEWASDTLAFNAIVLLLPWEWVEILLDFRSPCYSAPWGEGVYAKFSSMGNGYTFTLETLIFKAACMAIGSQDHAVYGDDIVLESHLVPDLVRLLRFLGFRTNVEKTYANPDSRFRESCGCDYYKGRLVTPFYCRSVPFEDQQAAVSHLLNGLISVSSGSFWTFAKSEIHRLKLLLVPYNGDSRSGVWVDPGFAWKTKILKTDRRRTLGKGKTLKENPSWGFPVYSAYVTRQAQRLTFGWRSLFLWHLVKGSPSRDEIWFGVKERLVYSHIRVKTMSDDLFNLTVKDNTRTDQVTTRVVYGHGVKRYFPIISSMTPCHLWAFTDHGS